MRRKRSKPVRTDNNGMTGLGLDAFVHSRSIALVMLHVSVHPRRDSWTALRRSVQQASETTSMNIYYGITLPLVYKHPLQERYRRWVEKI